MGMMQSLALTLSISLELRSPGFPIVRRDMLSTLEHTEHVPPSICFHWIHHTRESREGSTGPAVTNPAEKVPSVLQEASRGLDWTSGFL